MRKIVTVGVASVAGLSLMGSPLLAATTYEIDLDNDYYTALSSQGVAFWDFYNAGGGCNSTDGFTPLYDGGYVGSDDAFDDGFVVSVGATVYKDPDALATREGNVVKAGAPANVEGLLVSGTARAIQTSPTLQYLVKMRNPTAAAINKTIQVDTDLGSDNTTNVLATSNGNLTHENADRWLVSGDAPAAPFSDPIVTQVLKGKKAPAATTVTDALTTASECTTVEYTVKVPANATRYLLLFAEQNDDTGAGRKAAIKHAAVYDSQRTMDKVLKGVSPKIYSKIVNWNLKK